MNNFAGIDVLRRNFEYQRLATGGNVLTIHDYFVMFNHIGSIAQPTPDSIR